MEFTHTASNYNISSAQGTLNKNFTGAVDHAFSEFQQTKGSLLQGGNPKLTVSPRPPDERTPCGRSPSFRRCALMTGSNPDAVNIPQDTGWDPSVI